MQSWDIQPSNHRIKKSIKNEEKSRSIYAIQSPEPKQNFLDITALIRSLQRSEGENDCFRTPDIECHRTDCRWRKYCFNK